MKLKTATTHVHESFNAFDSLLPRDASETFSPVTDHLDELPVDVVA